MKKKKITKADLLKDVIIHVDPKSFDATPIINAYRGMSFTSRDIATATDIYDRMIRDKGCAIFLIVAGSTSAAGCKQVYIDLIRNNMVDGIVMTGAQIVDMDFFEGLGFHHYKGTPYIDDKLLRKLYIDRIYDTFIDEVELQKCDQAMAEVIGSLKPGAYSTREVVYQMGKFLTKHGKQDCIVSAAYDYDVPIWSHALIDSSFGFGAVKNRLANGGFILDVVKDFKELTEAKMATKSSGLFMIGGGGPKNFMQDTVVCAEVAFGKDCPMHKYAVQITVADSRDGACSSSTLKEALSWGKVNGAFEQMVYAEASAVLPLMASYLYHKGDWKKRKGMKLQSLFQ